MSIPTLEACKSVAATIRREERVEGRRAWEVGSRERTKNSLEVREAQTQAD